MARFRKVVIGALLAATVGYLGAGGWGSDTAGWQDGSWTEAATEVAGTQAEAARRQEPASLDGIARSATTNATEVPPPAEVRALEMRLEPAAGAARPRRDAPVVIAQAEREAPGMGRPTDAVGRGRLTRAIQTELKRVGCYTGSADGEWSAATRSAMKAFNDRVNATLPIAQPDYILLTLLQGHSALACGAACPQGQAQDDSGRCQPRSVLAETRRAGQPAEAAGAARLPIADAATAAQAREAAEQARREAQAASRRAAAEKSAEAERNRLDGERARIAAAEERRRTRAAEQQAKADAERQARLDEAERARAAAEARRNAEMAAQAARSAARASAVAAALPGPGNASASRASPTTATPAVAADAERGRAAPPPPPAGIASVTPLPIAGAGALVTTPTSKSRGGTQARFVSRFIPPPPYRLGRLDRPAPRARPPLQVVRVRAPIQPRAPRPMSVFKALEHRAP